MIKTAVVGYGFSARTFHLPFIAALPAFTLSAISTSRQDEAADAWPNATRYPDAATMIANADADLVIITAPNDAHYPLAELALTNGRHVIVEKPFVTEVAHGEALIELAAARQLVLSVYQNRRWDGDFLTVKQLIAEGALGDVRYYASHFDRFRPTVRQRWRELPGEGAGTWFDLGPHLIDQALELFGAPAQVTGRCLALRPGSETTDYFHVQLHYPDKEVILHGSPYSAGPNPRFQVQGSGGSYVKYGLDPQEAQLKAGMRPGDDGWALEAPATYGIHYTESGAAPVPTETGAYQDYFLGIAAAIEGDAPPPVTAESALAVIRVIATAIRSSETGRTLDFA